MMVDINALKDYIRDLKQKRKISGSFWTRTKAFKRLCQWAFKACDTSETKRVSKDELYTGLLLVYIHMARYAGPAACYPPSRSVVDTLFDACDIDKSGDISEDEFETIVIILSSQLTWRTVTYYVFLIMMLPYVVDLLLHFLEFVGFDTILKGLKHVSYSCVPGLDKVGSIVPASFWEQLPESLVSFLLFSAMVPFCWGRMDEYFQDIAEKGKDM